MEKSEASGEDENERTMREEKSESEEETMRKKGGLLSLSPPASPEIGGTVATTTAKNEGEENVVSEKTTTTRKGRRRTEDQSGGSEIEEFSDLGEDSKSPSSDERDEREGKKKERKKSFLEALRTEERAFLRNAQKAALDLRHTAPAAWRRFTRDARRRFRDLWRRAKAFKNGLSEEDKNLLKAAGVLVGARARLGCARSLAQASK